MVSIIRGVDNFDSAGFEDNIGGSLISYTVPGLQSQIDIETGFDANKYQGYELTVSNLTPTSDGASFEMWVTNGGGYGVSLRYGGFRQIDGTTLNGFHESGTNAKLSYAGNAADEYGYSGTIRWLNFHEEFLGASFQANISAMDRSRNYGISVTNGQVGVLGPLTGIRLKTNIGSLDGGIVRMYGIPR